MSALPAGTFNLVNESITMLGEVRTELENAMDFTSRIAVDLSKTTKGDNNRTIDAMKAVMSRFCQMDHEVQQFHDVADIIKNEFLGIEEVDPLATFEEKLAAMKNGAAGQNPEAHGKYVQMLNLIQDTDNQLDTSAKILNIEPEVIDEDLVVTQEQTSTRCPYTRQEMVMPVTNKHCGHSYDLEGIMDLIKNRGNKARCPVSGCINGKPLAIEDLEENKELKKLIDRSKKQKRDQQ